MLALIALACTTSNEGSPSPSSAPVVAPAPALPDPANAMVRYRLAFPDAPAQRIEVEAVARCPPEGRLTWWMAVWTPGSYLVREYARHVERAEALGPDGPLPLEKIAKNRWTHPCTAGAPAQLRYSLYAATLSVRGAYVDDELGILNGAATFVVPEVGPGPLDLQVEPWRGWAGMQTGLSPHPSGDPHRFLARDVDELFDSPIVMGPIAVSSFDVADVAHHLVTVGVRGQWDQARAARDVATITKEIVSFWGEIPYAEYRYLNVLAQRGGGLEHLDSTLMMTRRDQLALRADRLRWLGLVAHEFFHTWNVKRLRPRGLGPFDYETEVYTPSLWVAEGLTSYYDDLLLVRSGLMRPQEYWERLSSNVQAVQERPGRTVQPLADASFDTWIKHYRRDENSRNATVSYYTKGAVVGWLLDAEIRRATSGRASLDEVLRQMWARHRHEGFTPEQFRQVAREVAGAELDGFFGRYVDRAEELDYGGALQWFGLRFAPPPEPSEDDPAPGWLGATVGVDSGRLVVREVLRTTPAWAAGVVAGDELIALDDERLDQARLTAMLQQLGEGHEGELLVSRRERLRRIPVRLGAAPAARFRIEPDPGASPLARRRRSRWLGQ